MSYNLSGSENEIITTTTKTSLSNGTACNIDFTSMSYTLGANNYIDNSYVYYTQDGLGNIFVHGTGDENGDKWITLPSEGFIKYLGNPMAVGDSLSNTVTYSNGDTTTYSYTVTDKEYAATSVANYESYRVSMIRTPIMLPGPIRRSRTRLRPG